jgi:hypothetical protein
MRLQAVLPYSQDLTADFKRQPRAWPHVPQYLGVRAQLWVSLSLDCRKYMI